MKPILAYEKKLYFKNFKDYFISFITKEHNYLLWKYICYLRKEETAQNKIIEYFYRRKKNILGSKIGVTIYKNSCQRGLHIWHMGSIVINGNAKIGEDCVLHGQNCIGNKGEKSDDKAPIIGKKVDVGVGASIIGNVYIADNVKIGAGAVVTKSCFKKGAVLVGIPAKEIDL